MIDSGINMADLEKLAHNNPKYTRLYAGLAGIDSGIKKMVTDTIEEYASNPAVFYIKTILMNQCYIVQIYDGDTQCIIGTSWPLANFLEECQSKTIQLDVVDRVKKIINKFGTPGLSKGDKINWI